jgi:hypothetical protein
MVADTGSRIGRKTEFIDFTGVYVKSMAGCNGETAEIPPLQPGRSGLQALSSPGR